MDTVSKPAIQPDFLGLRELAAKMGVNYRTVHRAVHAGKIRSVKFGSLLKVPRREVERILAKGF